MRYAESGVHFFPIQIKLNHTMQNNDIQEIKCYKICKEKKKGIRIMNILFINQKFHLIFDAYKQFI